MIPITKIISPEGPITTSPPVLKTLETGQLISIPEGPITTISHELLEYILIFTNESENTLLVSRDWKDLTFSGLINWNKQKIQQIIRLVSIQLPNTHAKCIRELEQLQDAHQSLSGHVTTFAEVRRLFLIVKGSFIGIIRKLPEETRDRLQTAIGEELPDSMKDLFEISKLDLESVENVDLDTFFTLLQSCQPLSIEDRQQAVSHAAEINNVAFVKLLQADGPISEENLADGPNYCRCLEWGIWEATLDDDLEIVRVLLANTSISENYRGVSAFEAAGNNNVELVKLFLDNGQISQEHRGDAVFGAVYNKNPKLLILLLANGPISDESREKAIKVAMGIDAPETLEYDSLESIEDNAPETIGDDTIETVKLLLASGPISQECREDALVGAAGNNNLELVRLLLANGPITERYRGSSVLAAAGNNNSELVELLLANGPISEELRGPSVVEAAENNNSELVELLLANGPISEELRERAVKIALDNRYPKIAELLLASGPITERFRGPSVVEAAENNNSELVELLLANGPISEELRERAVKIALDNRYPKIAELLLASGLISGEG